MLSCFLFSGLQSPKVRPVVYPREKPWGGQRQTSVMTSAMAQEGQTDPAPLILSNATSGEPSAPNVSSWMTPSSSWLPASRKRGPC